MKIYEVVYLLCRKEDVYYSEHAALDMIRKGITHDDVCYVLCQYKPHKKVRDETGESIDGFKYTYIGQTESGRFLYIACKVVNVPRLGLELKIISCHE